MKPTELQAIVDRQPFRPFGVNLSSGNTYEFSEARNLGAPETLSDTLFYFGEEMWVLIDLSEITEVFSLK